jgi:DNA processing protein
MATGKPTTRATNRERLGGVLAALRVEHRPARLRNLLRHEGAGWVTQTYGTLDDDAQSEVDLDVDDLDARGVAVTWLGDDLYPAALSVLDKAPPILFTIGNTDLLSVPSIGMCGSRHASEIGIAAARNCGETVADFGLAIVSGYAKGVDTETHLAALRLEGSTVIVLAEGIRHFRKKRDFAGVDLSSEQVLVVSSSRRRSVGTLGGHDSQRRDRRAWASAGRDSGR